MKKTPLRLLIFAVWLLSLGGCLGLEQGLKPVSLEAHFQQKALALEEQGELRQALLAWRVAAGLNPDNPLTQKIIATLTRTIERQAHAFFEKGQAAYQKGEYNQARQAFLDVLGLTPDNPEALGYLKERLPSRARMAYTVKKGDSFSKIAVNTYQEVDYAYVVAYFNDLDPDKPLLTGTRLLLPQLPAPYLTPRKNNIPEDAGHPDHGPIPATAPGADEPASPSNDDNYQQAMVLITEKRYSDALVLLNKIPPEFKGRHQAIDRVNQLIRAHSLNAALQEAQTKLARKEYEAAHSLLTPLISQTPRNAKALQLMNQTRYAWAKELIALDEEIQAIELLQTLTESYQDTRELLAQAKGKLNARAESYYRKGVRHFLNEELELAIDAWQMALKLNPQHPKAAGDMENAVRLLEKWRDIDAPGPSDTASPPN